MFSIADAAPPEQRRHSSVSLPIRCFLLKKMQRYNKRSTANATVIFFVDFRDVPASEAFLSDRSYHKGRAKAKPDDFHL
jgi:hypothetical protein